jgi:predicted outer membrane repeat protein
MRRWEMVRTGLLAAVLPLAISCATASAATTLKVNGQADEKLSGNGRGTQTCETEGGACTLRAAVELANEVGEATIEVPEGKYIESLAPSALAIEKDANVTIVGVAADKTTIEGEGHSHVFEVTEGSTLTVDGATIEHGQEDDGGGVYVASGASLVLERSVLTENSANEDGGGVYGGAESSIDVKDSTISENSAELGGAIYADNYSQATIEASEIKQNRASRDGGGVYGEYGASVLAAQSSISENESAFRGGGIYGEVDSSLTVRQSTVSENAAGEGGGGVTGVVGEDVCVDSRADHAGARARAALTEMAEGLTIEQSTIEGNLVEAGDGGGVEIYVDVYSGCDNTQTGTSARPSKARVRPALDLFGEGEVLIQQSTIANNAAEEGDSNEPYQGLGGGIYEEGFYEDPIVNSTIADNISARNGAGVAATENAFAVLVSDTVFANTVEALNLQTEAGAHGAKRSRPDTVADAAQVGNNLATENEQGGEATIALRNTIVAEPKGEEVENCEGEIESLVPGFGYNLDDPSNAAVERPTDTCGLSRADNDLVGEQPGLDEGEGLTDNGGLTDTIALLSASPAIGFVAREDCTESEYGPASIDQRGEPRPGLAGEGCDVGAYEYQGKAAETPKNEEVKNEEPKTEENPARIGTASTSVLPFVSSAPAQQCLSQRDITIHIQHARQLGIASAVISIDGHAKRTLRGRHLSTAIDLRGLPQGTFTVGIVARTRSGHTLRGRRVYHTCHTKLPGHSYLRL